MFHVVRSETFSRYVKSKQIISDYRKETQSLNCFFTFLYGACARGDNCGGYQGLSPRFEITNSKMTAEIRQITHCVFANA